MADTSTEDFDDLIGSPEADAEEPVHVPIYNPDVVTHVGLGAVENITLINFMCHDHFSIAFGPQVNFVIGRNGSGKSAILTALVVCFGGSAGLTNRGKAVKSFIKKGQTVARVIVEICNHSDGNTDFSYQYDTYGRKIVIERTFRTDGVSTYQIRNENGQMIDKTKKEMDCIIRHFSIQIDNPVVILNQEVSRNFLNTRKADEKYKFFMRATNLEDHKENLIKLKRRLDWANGTKQDKERILPDLEAEVRGLKQKLDHLKSVKGFRDKKEKKENELLWSFVREKEDELKNIEKELANEQSKWDLLKKNADKYEERIAGLKADQEALSAKMQEHNAIVNEAARQTLAARKEVERLDKEKQTLVYKRREQMTLKREKDILIEKYEKGIQDEIEKQGDPASIRRERELRHSKMDDLQDEITRLDTAISEKKLKLEKLKEWLFPAENSLENLANERDNVKRQLDGIQNKINQLQSSGNDNRSRFGAFVPRVNDMIEAAARDGKFRVKPIGPIGQYISLNDQSVSTALQGVMKGLVRAYAVDNADDQRKLREIFRTLIPNSQQHPQIITRKFSRHRFDVAANLVRHTDVRSLLEHITVTDDNAFNVLIDKTGIEKVAYIPDNRAAERMLINKNTVPRNCWKAYSKDGTEFNPTTDTKGFSMYPNEYFNRSDIFSLDIAGQVDRLKQELERKKKELDAIVESGRTKKQDIENRRKDLRTGEEEITALRGKRNKLNSELTVLKDFVEPEPVSVASLQAELDEHRLERQNYSDGVDELNEKIKELDTERSDAQKVVTEKEELKSDAESKLKLQVSRRNKLAEEIRLVEASRSERDLLKQQEKVAAVQEKANTAAAEVTKLVEETSAKCERVESRHRPEELRHQIKELGKLIADCEKETGTEAEVLSKYTKANNNAEKVKTVISVVTSCITRCTEMLAKRRDLFYRTRAAIVIRMKSQFEACLKSLEYTGSLEIEHGGNERVNGEVVHRKAKLTLKVNPKGANNDTAYNDTRSLSGGERSFSTVAFLLALWEGCNSPFRILDEVDVFMDMITRQVAMDALVSAALDNKRQYIFLSPLPLIQDHAKNKSILIHHMPEPVRVGNESTS